MQVRRLARELALLSMSQLPSRPHALEAKTIEDIMLAAVRALTEESRELLVVAGADLQRSQDKLFASEVFAATLEEAKDGVREAIRLGREAIERAGYAIEFPELLQVAQRESVRAYALELLLTIHRERLAIDRTIERALIDWQLKRLPQLDRAILRMATAEMLFLGIPPQVAINEAVELAKRYCGEDGYRFINGVLRGIVALIGTKEVVALTDEVLASEIEAETPPPQDTHPPRSRHAARALPLDRDAEPASDDADGSLVAALPAPLSAPKADLIAAIARLPEEAIAEVSHYVSFVAQKYPPARNESI